MSEQTPLTDLLEFARSKGAVGAEILDSQSTGRRVRVDQGRIVEDGPFSKGCMTVRVWLEGGKAGFASGSASRAEKMIVSAIKSAGSAPADPHGGPTDRLVTDPRGLGILDRRYQGLGASDRLDVVVGLERAGQAIDRRVSVTAFDYEDALTLRRFVNTHSVAVEERSTLFRCSGGVTGPNGELSIEGTMQGRTFADVASLPLGAALARRVVRLLKSQTSVSGPVRVMLAPFVTAEIFGELAQRMGRDQSHFLDGGRRLDSRIHMLDDGVAPGGLFTRGFDDRGVRPVPIMLIREGRADGRFLDVGMARRRDERPTGHERGGKLVRSNLQLRGGSRSMNALMAEMSEPVLVLDHLSGFSKGINWKTGALSCRCSGRIQRNGKTEGMVRHMTFTGNLAESLSRIVDLASDTDRVDGVDAPAICVDGFSIGS